LGRRLGVPGSHLLGGLLAEVMRAAHAVAGLLGLVELVCDGSGLCPFARALVDGKQRQPGLVLVAGAFELLQRSLGAVEQPGAQEVLRQRVLRAVAIGAAQVAPAQQVLVHAHGPLVFAAAAEEVAEREVQLLCVGVVLHGLDEGVDGLVLLLVEEEVEAAEVGLGSLEVLDAQLPKVEARGEPAQDECERQAEQQPAEVKVHVGVRRAGRSWQRAAWV
jgi:hypothetical protein